MSARTILLDFTIESPSDENQITTLSAAIETALRDHLDNLKEINRCELENGVLKVYAGDRGAVVTLRFYKNGLVTVNIEYFKEDGKEAAFNFEKLKKIENQINERAQGVLKSGVIVPIKRSAYPKYYPTSDERLVEYDVDKVVFNETSRFQKVEIVHSRSLGNMLVLDGLQNLCERDAIYTDTLMRKPLENYKNKEIAILGGGDGALLYELLKLEPKEVVVLEIDEVVIRACAEHMRSLCGDCLDRKSGPNYKIIVTDCLVALDQYAKEGRKFDYVFGDLTDVPISDDPELWEFMEKVIQKIFKVLKPDGKLMTQVCGAVCVDALKKYQNILKTLPVKVHLETQVAFIPSFMEDWVFGYINFVKEV